MSGRDGLRQGRLAAGTQIDHYVVMRFLARGGMGDVYLARDAQLGRKVALKLVKPERADTSAVDLFLVEARATATFSHPHIVAIFAVGEYQGSPYLVLEYLEGGTLRERIADAPPSLREAQRYGLAIAEAIGEAHRKRVLHLDLKPENVVIPKDGRARVVDFGLARLARADAGEAGQVQGTPAYMAPEQWEGREVSTATDVWALGTILYELAAGQRPYLVQTASELRVLVTAPEPAPRVAAHRHIPADLADLIDSRLEKDPAQRPSVDAAEAALRRMLTRSPAAEGEQNPFRGLLPFGEHHAELFCGRDGEIAAALERLRELPVLPVVGASGAGKTSFVRAGIIPRLREQGPWTVLQVRPGSAPFHSLAFVLASGESAASGSTRSTAPGAEPEAGAEDPTRSVTDVEPTSSRPTLAELALPELERDLEAAPPLLGQLLRKRAQRDRGKVLLVVDQLEEVVTLCEDDARRRAFLRAVCLAADDDREPVRVIFTVRDDFLSRLAEVAEMRAALTQVTVLHSPGAEALREILVKPLAATGYRFDDPTLVDEMVTAVQHETAALPLLQFALHLMWERRDRSARTLTRAAYETMGGVAGALASRADEVLVGLGDADARLVREVLLRLVTPDRTRRVVPRSQLGEGLAGADPVIDRLIQARLLTVRRSQGAERDDPELELAHEALVRAWGRLARWLDEGREELIFLAEIGQAAELWQRRGRREGEAWEGDDLREARRWLDRSTTSIPQRVREFIAASERKERRRRRRRVVAAGIGVGVLAVAAVVASVVAVAFSQKNRLVEGERREAERRRAEAQVQDARWALDRGELLEARASLRSGLEIQDSPRARALWARLSRTPQLWSKPWGRMVRTRFTPDGTLVGVAGGAGSLNLVDADTGAVTRALRQRELAGTVYGIDFSADGRWLALATDRGEVGLFDLTGGDFRLVDAHQRSFTRVALTRDGRRLATMTTDQTVALWDLAAGARVELPGARAVASFAFSLDDRLLADCASDGKIRLWDVATGASAGVLDDARAGTADVAFGPRGLLASAGIDGRVLLWDLTERRLLAELRGHTGNVKAVAFSPRGDQLASGGFDGTIVLWSLAGHEATPAKVLRGHGGLVWSVAYSTDGRRLVSTSVDGTIRAWDLELGPQLTTSLAPQTEPLYVSFSPDGKLIASGHVDRTVRLWEVATGKVARVFPPLRDPLSGVSFSPDGELLAVGDLDGTVRLFDPRTGAGKISVGSQFAPGVFGLEFAPDGASLLTSDVTGAVHVWDLTIGSERRRIETGRPNSAAFFSPGGKRILVLGESEDAFSLWEASSGKLQRRVVAGDGAENASFLDEETLLLLGRTARTFDLESGASRTLIELPSHPTVRLCSGDGGALLALNTEDRVTHVFDLKAGRELWSAPHEATPHNCAFSDDGALLVTTSDALRLWQARTGRPVWHGPEVTLPPSVETPPLEDAPASHVLRTLAGPGGSLAVGFADGTVGLWHEATGILLASGKLHGRAVVLETKDGELQATSDLGDHLALDLSPYAMTYCDILRQVWTHVPVVWERNEAVRRPPPGDHACRR